MSVDRNRPAAPSHAKIAAAWAALPVEDLERTFPHHSALWIGWGEPMCFRCGWLAPVPDAATYPPSRSSRQRINAAWNSVGAWLERAHLHDYVHGGSNHPLNYACLCVLCHENQPECETREQGIAYVAMPVPSAEITLLEAATEQLFHGKRPTGHPQALRWMLRAKALVADATHEVLREDREADQ